MGNDDFGVCEKCPTHDNQDVHPKADMRLHHTQYRSAGNPDPLGDQWLCVGHHTALHSEAGDFAFWGGIGGDITSGRIIERGEEFVNLQPRKYLRYKRASRK